MKYLKIVCSAILISMGVMASAYSQQPPCAPFKETAEALKNKFNEEPVEIGVLKGGKFGMMLFTSPKGETWTMGILDEKGMFCLLGVGENWADTSSRNEREAENG